MQLANNLKVHEIQTTVVFVQPAVWPAAFWQPLDVRLQGTPAQVQPVHTKPGEGVHVKHSPPRMSCCSEGFNTRHEEGVEGDFKSANAPVVMSNPAPSANTIENLAIVVVLWL